MGKRNSNPGESARLLALRQTALAEGSAAFAAGIDREDNPYLKADRKSESWLWGSWSAGWDNASNNAKEFDGCGRSGPPIVSGSAMPRE